MKLFKIARKGVQILELSEADVVAGLSSGAVLPSDHYWTQSMSGWDVVSNNTAWRNPVPPPSAAPLPPPLPTPSSSTTRKGKVLDFNISQSYGLISGDDGIRYNFQGAEWRTSKVMPVYGVRVEFLSNGATANAIYATSTQDANAPSSSSGGLSKEYEGYYRSIDENMLAGICAGLAHKWGHSTFLVRVVVFLFLPFGLWFIYPILWLAWQGLPTKNIN
jgi:phage shock protein PspC (stress-responsive transcriptional regulator)